MTTPKYIIILLLIIPLHGTAQTVRIPAEWEKQEKVWLSWFGQERRDSTSCRVIEALQPHVPLSINVESDSMKMAAIQYMSGYNIDVSKLDFVKDAYADFYIRDYVFFVKDAADKLQIV